MELVRIKNEIKCKRLKMKKMILASIYLRLLVIVSFTTEGDTALIEDGWVILFIYLYMK